MRGRLLGHGVSHSAEPDPPPWRLEGAPPPDPSPPRTGRRWLRSPRFWCVVAAALAVNWFVASRINHGEERARVPYTFFRDQLQARNISDVRSSGEPIRGALRRAVSPTG